MDRRIISRVCGIVPIVFSLAAFGIVIVAVSTGWGLGGADEGAGAHIFQLLIAAEVPFVLLFAVTAEWKRTARVAGTIALQAATLVLAFAPVAFFKL
ncbi:MAG: hypothetical protein NVSMB19_10990 [Vulcanimicrobiaceae bacterium]